MRFSFAIVCSNDHCLLECLKSIQEDIPIIVVQNFPDKYVQTICDNDKRISIFRCDERNLGKLRQIAADNCETPGICYIDSDCVIERGLVNIVEDELDHYCAINIPMIYRYHNRSTKIVSECRRFTTSDRLLLVPFAFRLDIQKKIGSLFNTALSWGEDSDQRNRLAENNLEYHISNAKIYHKALTVREDTRSAIRLGRGTFIRENVLHKEKRSLVKDLSILHELIGARNCYKNTGSIFAALYHLLVWRPAYKLGYWIERIKRT